MKSWILLIICVCYSVVGNSITDENTNTQLLNTTDWTSPLIRSMGGLIKHTLPPQPFSFRSNCMRLQSWGLRTDNDYISVTCIWNYGVLRNQVFPKLASEILPKKKHIIGVWTRASQYLQSTSFVAICQLHCLSGRPYPRLDGSEEFEPADVNVGCSSAFKMRCKQVCPESVFLVPNGKVSCSDGDFASSTCTASCNSGYSLRGPSKKKCNSVTNEWLPRDSFKCIASFTCSSLPTLQNGVYNCTSSNDLFSRCEVVCKKGFTAPQPRVAWCAMDHKSIPQWMWVNTDKPGMIKSAAPKVGQALKCRRECITGNDFVSSLFISTANTPEVLAVLRRLVLCNIALDLRTECEARTQQRCQAQGCCWHLTKDRRSPSCYNPSQTNNNAADKTLSSGSISGKQNYVSSLPSLASISSLYPYLMNKCGCGSKVDMVKHPQPKIYNGKPRQVTWQALIYFNNQLCGGTLITPHHVITAAHCVNPKDGSFDRMQSNYVFLGLYNVSNYNNGTKTYKIAAIERHFNFTLESSGYTYNDIAVIRLASPVVFTATIQPLCLPRFKLPSNNLECQISGYGKHSSFQAKANVLNSAFVTIVSTYKCAKYYPSFPFKGTTLCAGSQLGFPADTCSGDSGGPLACRIRSSSEQCNWFLVGITSFGQVPCGSAPSVYTNVMFYQSWIVQAIVKLEKQLQATYKSGWNPER